MEAIRPILDGVWWVGGGSWGKRTKILSAEGSSNVFLVGRDGDYALIDAGSLSGVNALIRNSEAAGAKRCSISSIIITHSHSDHTDGTSALAKRTGAAVKAHPLATKALAGDKGACKLLMFKSEKKVHAEILREGQILNFGPFKFKVIYTPGHIPDAVVLSGKIAGKTVIFTGDTVIGDQFGAKGIVGWLDGHWGSNPNHLLKSIQKIDKLGADVMLAGHGNPIMGKSNVKLSLKHCAERVQKLLDIQALHTMMPLDMSK